MEDFVNILRCESQCSAVPYRPISVINVPELGQQPYPGSFAWFSCLILFRATLDISAVHCICIIQKQPWISKKTGKYYTKIINRSKVKFFQNIKVEGRGSIYSNVKGSVAAYSQQGRLSLKSSSRIFVFHCFQLSKE